MIVFVESNFVLEIVLEQEDSQTAKTILSLAENQKINLTVPIFGLIEPSWTLNHREKERVELYRSLNEQSSQLRRSGLHHSLADVMKDIVAEMRAIENKELSSFEATLRRIIATGNLLDIDKTVFIQALNYQNQYKLSLQDAVILASVINDLRKQDLKEPKCFISRDAGAFGRAEIKLELNSYNCRYIAKFEDGLSFIQSSFNQPQP
jgi:predicted nucleic acid-binding protein